MNTLKHDCTDQEHHDWVLENLAKAIERVNNTEIIYS